MVTVPSSSYFPAWADIDALESLQYYEIKPGVPLFEGSEVDGSFFYNEQAGGDQFLAVGVVNCVLAFAAWYGRPIKINSGYRNYIPTGPGVYGAVTQSPHMCSVAIDFAPVQTDPNFSSKFLEFLEYQEEDTTNNAIGFGVKYVGVYPTFIHVDVLPTRPWEGYKVKPWSWFNIPSSKEDLFDYDFIQPIVGPVGLWVSLLLVALFFGRKILK